MVKYGKNYWIEGFGRVFREIEKVRGTNRNEPQ